MGHKNDVFVGSDRGSKSAAITYTLMETAKLNSVDPQAWFTDNPRRIADHKINRNDDMLSSYVCSVQFACNNLG